ncbi:MAG: TRAP transporter large permease subunit [Geminicoccaceae bacterium]
MPMLLPVTDAYGIDRVHLGIILQLGLLIGIVTPPMGIGLSTSWWKSARCRSRR